MITLSDKAQFSIYNTFFPENIFLINIKNSLIIYCLKVFLSHVPHVFLPKLDLLINYFLNLFLNFLAFDLKMTKKKIISHFLFLYLTAILN